MESHTELIMEPAQFGSYIISVFTPVIRLMVNHPNEVTITPVQGPQTLLFEIRVDKRDLGFLIGKQGKTASALRTLLMTMTAKYKQRAVFELIEE